MMEDEHHEGDNEDGGCGRDGRNNIMVLMNTSMVSNNITITVNSNNVDFGDHRCFSFHPLN